MTTSKTKMTARRHQLRGFLLGVVLVSLVWIGSLYGRLEQPVTNPQIADEKAHLTATPSFENMASKRANFTHDQVHAHATPKHTEEIAKKLTAIGIEPNPGTLDLIDTMGERYNRMSIQVAIDLEDIASGHYESATLYGVKLERRLVGNSVAGQGSKPLAIKDLRYEIIQTWKGTPPTRRWRIGNKIFGIGDVLPQRRNLPDNPKIAAQSFLDVMPSVMSAT